MNFQHHDRTTTLKSTQANFDYPPYNYHGDGLPRIAQLIEEGDCRSYSLTVENLLLKDIDTLLGLIERFTMKHPFPFAQWSGLGDTLEEKITARRNIDYYRLNLKERIAFIDADSNLGDECGGEIESEILALFPELSFSSTDTETTITLHIPSRY